MAARSGSPERPRHGIMYCRIISLAGGLLGEVSEQVGAAARVGGSWIIHLGSWIIRHASWIIHHGSWIMDDRLS